MEALKQFLKRPGTYVGMVVALSLQLIFFCVWLTADDGVNERADQMRIAIVNEDVNIGSKIAESLQRYLPFQEKEERYVEQATKEMNAHVYE